MEQYNHFAYGLDLTQKMVLFQPKVEKAYFESPNSDTLLSLSQRLSSINHPILIAIDGNDADYEDNNAEVVMEKPQYFFMILMPASSDNAAKILEVQAQCKANCRQIQAKLIADSRKYKFGGLLIDSFTMRSIGPVGENLYGIIMGFQLEQSIDYRIKNDFWI